MGRKTGLSLREKALQKAKGCLKAWVWQAAVRAASVMERHGAAAGGLFSVGQGRGAKGAGEKGGFSCAAKAGMPLHGRSPRTPELAWGGTSSASVSGGGQACRVRCEVCQTAIRNQRPPPDGNVGVACCVGPPVLRTRRSRLSKLMSSPSIRKTGRQNNKRRINHSQRRRRVPVCRRVKNGGGYIGSVWEV